MDSRYSKITITLLATLIAGLTLIPAGCGGGGGGNGGNGGGGGGGGGTTPITPASASGTVALPTGSKLVLSQLTVNTGIDTQPVSAKGTFTVHTVGNGLCPVLLEDASGNAVMAGYVDSRTSGTAYAGGKGHISATDTATFLMFYSLEGYTMPMGYYDQVMAAVAAEPQIKTVAATVAARIAANPLALVQKDAQIVSAVSTATTTIENAVIASQPRVQPGAQVAADGPGVQAMTVKVLKPQSGNSYQVLVTPGEQSGITPLIESTSTGATLSFVNTYRRRCAAFAYETAIETQAMGQLQYITPVPVETTTNGLFPQAYSAFGAPQPVVPAFPIQPSNALHGTIGSIIDKFYGYPAFTPARTDGMNLPVDPSNVETDFTIIVVGPSALKQNFDQIGLQSLQKYVPDWKNTIGALVLTTATLDIVVPLAFSLPFTEEFAPQAGIFGNGAAGDIMNAVAAAPDTAVSYQAGDQKGFDDSVVQNLGDSGNFRDNLIKNFTIEFYSAYKGTPTTESLAKITSFFKQASLILSVADFVLLTADVSTIIWSTFHTNPLEWWTAKVLTGICGPDPAPVLSSAYTMTLNKQNYYGGQTGTLTIKVAAGNKELTNLQVDMQYNTDNGTIPITNLTLDGKVVKNPWPGGQLFWKLTNPGEEETHTLQITFGQPVNGQGKPVDFCSAVAQGPQFVLQGFGPYDTFPPVAFLYFNVLPADVK